MTYDFSKQALAALLAGCVRGLFVLPCYTKDDTTDSISAYTHIARKLRLTYTALAITVSDIRNLPMGQFCTGGQFAASYRFGMGSRAVPLTACNTIWMKDRLMAFACSSTTLLLHILRVVSGCAQKQVSRVDTCSYVTAVAYKQTRRYLSKVQFPGKPMGLYSLAVLYSPIPVLIFTACPQPACGGFIDVGKESIMQRSAIPIDSVTGLAAKLTTAVQNVRWAGVELGSALKAGLRGAWSILIGHHDLLRGVMASVVDAARGRLHTSIIASQSHKINFLLWRERWHEVRL